MAAGEVSSGEKDNVSSEPRSLAELRIRQDKMFFFLEPKEKKRKEKKKRKGLTYTISSKVIFWSS